MLEGVQDQVSLVAVAGWRQKGGHDREAQEHEAILAAVEGGDFELAGSLSRAHMEGFARRLLANLEEDDT
jgi:DNA-binding FadR family transcriptional regulator